nr:hypothetical protein [Tanacetum cinerariifolium]
MKINVDTVEEGCSKFPVARPTNEVKTLHDALDGQFIQWPRKYIRIDKPMSSQALLIGHGHHHMARVRDGKKGGV